MIFDTHAHTIPFSTDSSMTIEELLEKQKQSGIGVILTEHMDFEFGGPKEYVFEPKEYFDTYAAYRNENLLLGVEIGMQTSVVEKNIQFVTDNPYDMVIGSVHAVNGVDLYDASFYAAYEDKKDAYEAYLRTNIENVKQFDEFDTLGHIDYVCRQAPYVDTQIYYENYADEWDTLLKQVIEKGKSLELNTRRLNDTRAVEALLPIYQRYYELGGRYITLGSDSHKAEAIGAHFHTAMSIAERCHLKPVYYKQRKIHDFI